MWWHKHWALTHIWHWFVGNKQIEIFAILWVCHAVRKFSHTSTKRMFGLQFEVVLILFYPQFTVFELIAWAYWTMNDWNFTALILDFKNIPQNKKYSNIQVFELSQSLRYAIFWSSVNQIHWFRIAFLYKSFWNEDCSLRTTPNVHFSWSHANFVRPLKS